MDDEKIAVRDTPIHAVLLFADIIESSKYSAVLSYGEYAKRLLDFQESFLSLAERYFPEPEDRTSDFREVSARGDEGLVFLAPVSLDSAADVVFRLIEFLYHLKGILRFGREESDGVAASPRRIGLGAGIHVGRVAFAVAERNNRSVIARLEGFSINYAKRVESCSRLGKYSRIFLSKDAARLLEDKPVILSHFQASMKGIDDIAEVYEVQAGLFSSLNLSDDKDDNQLVDQAVTRADHPERIEEAWMKSLIVSILDYLLQTSPVKALRAKYADGQLRLAWHSSTEDDPILLYLRARDLGEKKEHTQQLRYLKELAQKYPEFVYVRKKMIQACWAIAKGKAERAEMVFARDMAKEFLDRFPQFLDAAEVREFRELIKKMARGTKGT